jgi:phospholipase A2
MFGQPITFVDIYGSVLSYNLLADQQRNSLHGTLAPRIRDGLYPLPIGCALGGDNKNPYYWFEFSPFEVGSPELNSYIPTWAFGRGFDKGSSVDFAPEQTLGYFLGVFGAAFAESEYKDFFDELLHKLREKNQAILSGIVNQILKDRNRKDVGGGKVHNFMHGLGSNPLTNVENLMFIDAGIIFDEARGVGANVPLLPFYRKERAVDIIIVVDASSNAGSAGELGNALDYVRKLGYVVPEVDYVKAGESVITTWYPVDNGPIIIYMPNIKNEQYSPDFDPRDITQVYNTFNFKYSLEQAQKLSDLISYNVQQSKDTIYQVIRNVVARNSNS